jgi:hypothetical protein
MRTAWRTVLDQPVAGALCWLLSLQVVPVELAVTLRWRRPYNFATDCITSSGPVRASGRARQLQAALHQALHWG